MISIPTLWLRSEHVEGLILVKMFVGLTLEFFRGCMHPNFNFNPLASIRECGGFDYGENEGLIMVKMTQVWFSINYIECTITLIL